MGMHYRVQNIDALVTDVNTLTTKVSALEEVIGEGGTILRTIVNPPPEDVVVDVNTLATRVSLLEGTILPPGAIETTIKVAHGLDDTYMRLYPFGVWMETALQIGVGYFADTAYGQGASMRFIVPIPQGKTILRAHLKLTDTGGNNQRIVRSEIGVEDVANAARVTSLADFLARPRKAIAWDDIEPWTVNTQFNSPSLKTLVQGIINKPDWVSGNAIQIFWDDRLDRSDHTVIYTVRTAYSYEASAGLAPKLYIAYM